MIEDTHAAVQPQEVDIVKVAEGPSCDSVITQ